MQDSTSVGWKIRFFETSESLRCGVMNPDAAVCAASRPHSPLALWCAHNTNPYECILCYSLQFITTDVHLLHTKSAVAQPINDATHMSHCWTIKTLFLPHQPFSQNHNYCKTSHKLQQNLMKFQTSTYSRKFSASWNEILHSYDIPANRPTNSTRSRIVCLNISGGKWQEETAARMRRRNENDNKRSNTKNGTTEYKPLKTER